ncbi:NAD(P)/FAD-dependent oxidoreductase [Parendozoicomonas haliclonae]|uniref:Protoporphyrinogen oxidase n=1 Tax=Parendozoicomonas haliclonae TaxID=1960125 RepID=A0A1X7AGQ7_9GAMM|nr:FAD-dependent oxidoreductase [Parendozoicomonas haliclonae]SMA40268.1 protoporphyrinogen oxidase [Parendozoicomonas haliclonae]
MSSSPKTKNRGLNIAVIGSGIAGLSSAWLLSRQHNVTLFEKDDRFGGHSNTVTLSGKNGQIDVDTGFIVFNERTYPNLTALFDYLDVPSSETDMSFAVSLNNGKTEYAGTDLNGLFAQRKNLFSPRFWQMITDILRFYRASGEWQQTLGANISLRQLLEKHSYSKAFVNEHLVPMGAAIWSTPADKMLDYPALAFLRFCENHGLLQLSDRPQWRTVTGGSREYVRRMIADIGPHVLMNSCVRKVRRYPDRVEVLDIQGREHTFDHVVMACHADTTLKLLQEPDELEQLLLGAFKFQRNRALLHSDKRFMPRNRKAWASWNYLGNTSEATQTQGNLGKGTGPAVTYWMNRLQHIDDLPLFVTLNPEMEPSMIHGSFLYDHPVFDQGAIEAQTRLWELQGRNRTWFCGAWFAYGFHEDGLQSGLAVAEELGGQCRPWRVEGQNDRLHLPEHWYSRATPTFTEASFMQAGVR